MEIDYSSIFSVVGECISYALPIGLAFGLCERLCSLVLDAALDRFHRRERL